jgi:Na+:H+ antiporter
VRLAEGDPFVEIALSMVLAYTAFVVADHYLHVSGIMAVVAAGLVAGALGRDRVPTEARAHLRHFWSYAEFVANSFVFLVLGIGGGAFLHRLLGGSPRALRDVGYAVLAVLLGRHRGRRAVHPGGPGNDGRAPDPRVCAEVTGGA